MHLLIIFLLSVFTELSTSNKVLFCNINGTLGKDNYINGTISTCEPETVICHIEGVPRLPLGEENIRCVEPNMWWTEEYRCSTMFVTRQQQCTDLNQCYGASFECPRKEKQLTLISWIVITFIVTALLLCGVCLLVMAYRNYHRRQSLDVKNKQRRVTLQAHGPGQGIEDYTDC